MNNGLNHNKFVTNVMRVAHNPTEVAEENRDSANVPLVLTI